MPSDQKTLGTAWTLSLVSMAPADFSYLFSPWNLNTTDTEHENYASFIGTGSGPIQWSVTPAFPTFLQFDDSKLNPGSIIQTPNTKPTVMAATNYTVTASITIADRTISKQTTITISVTDPTASASALEATVEANGTSSGLDAAVSSTFVTSPNAHSGTQINANNDKGISSTSSSGNPSENLMAHVLGAGGDKTTAEKYGELMAGAPAFFKWQQAGIQNLNEHCTASDAILKMRSSLTGGWKGFDVYYGNYGDIYFPNHAAAPAPMANDACDYEGAANAYVAQAIYNGNGNVKQNCNWDGAQGTINTFNTNLWNSNLNLYMAYLKGSQSTNVTGGPCSFDVYKSILLNPDWIAMKAAEQASAGWPNQTMEMFCHFLKLAAIGASDAQIASIFTSLTAPASGPKLIADGFLSVTPTTWKTYRGYISNVSIVYSQLNVTGLNQTKFVPNPYPWTGKGWVTLAADEDFIAVKHYWRNPPTGCCLQAGASVVLGDGKSLLPVEEVQPGQSILSPTLRNPLASTTMLWVSRPEQLQRSLYSYKDVPGVLFTATHPVSLGYDEHKHPILGFVDVATAVTVNPLWGAFTLRHLPTEQLVQHAPQETSRTLFDLVLDQKGPEGESIDAPTFVVQSSTGKRVTVCSEAPNIAKLPATSRFMLSFARGIGECHDLNAFLPHGLRTGVLDYYAMIKKHRNACASQALSKDIHLEQLTKPPHSLDISTVLSVFSQASLEPQILADSIEAITASLGLSLQSHLDDGWQHASAPSLPDETVDLQDPPLMNILSTHFLQLIHSEIGPLSPPVATAHKTLLATLQRLLLSKPRITATVSHTPVLQLHKEAGWQDSNSAGFTVVHGSLGPFLHTTRCTLQLPPSNNFISKSGDSEYTLRLTINSSITLQAQGSIVPDVEARWPLHVSSLSPDSSTSKPQEISNGASASLISSDDDIIAARGLNVGWISITCGSVAAEAMKTCELWTGNDSDGNSISPLERYAEALGKMVGTEIAETVGGPVNK